MTLLLVCRACALQPAVPLLEPSPNYGFIPPSPFLDLSLTSWSNRFWGDAVSLGRPTSGARRPACACLCPVDAT